MKVREIFVLPNHIAFVNIEKHCVAKDGHDEENQHEQYKDVKERVHRHYNGLKQRLQTLVFTSESEYASDSQHAQNSGQLGTHCKDLAASRVFLTTIRLW